MINFLRLVHYGPCNDPVEIIASRAKTLTEIDMRRPGGRNTQTDISGFSGSVLMEVWNTDKLQVLTHCRVSNGARFELVP